MRYASFNYASGLISSEDFNLIQTNLLEIVSTLRIAYENALNTAMRDQDLSQQFYQNYTVYKTIQEVDRLYQQTVTIKQFLYDQELGISEWALALENYRVPKMTSFPSTILLSSLNNMKRTFDQIQRQLLLIIQDLVRQAQNDFFWYSLGFSCLFIALNISFVIGLYKLYKINTKMVNFLSQSKQTSL